MTYTEFICNIKETLSDHFEDSYKIYIKSFTKNNGKILDGLIICNPDFNISPTIYLNPYYSRYLDGENLEDIYEDILSTYNKYMPDYDFDVDFITNYDSCKSNIVFKLINYNKNEELLSQIPHLKYLDFAIIFQVILNSDSVNSASITIRNDLLDTWNKTIDDLHTEANKNTPLLLPARLLDMNDFISNIECIPNINESIPMQILTNINQTNGASVILYDGLLKKLSGELECDLILIPCSIHEFIILPTYHLEQFGDLISLSEIITTINKTSVLEEDVLSDHAYLYDHIRMQLLIPD